MTNHIEDLENEIKTKQLILAALKKEEKENKKVPFAQTKFGSTYYRTIQGVTSKFVSMHQNAVDHLNNPERIHLNRLLNTSTTLLNKAAKLNREKNEKKSTNMAVTMAEHVMEVEDFIDSNRDVDQDLINHQSSLQKEIERLRPPKDLEKTEQITNLLSQLVEEN